MAKVLIAGVPYGTGNVGDEAILAAIVAQLRALNVPGLEITVVTASPEATAKKLRVACVPLLFDKVTNRPVWSDEIRHACKHSQVYIHGGATGIHDYPMHMLAGLALAKECGCKTVVYGTGGGVYHHKFYEGRKTRLLLLMSKLTLNLVDFRKIAEAIVSKSCRRKIAGALSAVDLLLVRDAETRETLTAYGMDPAKIHICGDAAFALQPAGPDAAAKIAAAANLWNDGKPIVGVCIASQKKVVDMAAVARICDDIIEKYGAHVLFVPMDPVTDVKTSDEIASKMKRGGETRIIRRAMEPEEMLAFLPRLHAIISSRLHLIILGAVAGVPSVGIGRGSGKVTAFQKRFGLDAAGDYLTVNYDILSRRFDEVWRRHAELAAIIKAEMQKARKAFKDASRLLIPILM